MLFSIILVDGVLAQEPARIWTQPSAYNIDEDVTIYVDVAGTPLETIVTTGDIYMWSWGNGYDEDNNGEWTNSAESAKWEKEEGTTIVKRTFSPITEIWPDLTENGTISFLLKAKDGDIGKTGDILWTWPDWKSVISGKILATYPAKFQGTHNVSILVDVSKAYHDKTETGKLIGGPVSAHTGVNGTLTDGWQNVVEGSEEKAALTDMGDNIWRLDMVPSEFYEFNEDIFAINILFNKAGDWSASGRDVGGVNFLIEVEVPVSLTETPIQMFPSAPIAEDIVTYLFDTKLIDNGLFFGKTTVKIKAPTFEEVTATATGEQLNLTSVGNGMYRLTIVPKDYFELTDEQANAGGVITIIVTDDVDESSPFEFEIKSK